MSKTSFEAGFLIRGQIRRELERAVFMGELGSFKELKGWLESEFLLTDPKPSVIRWLRQVETDMQEQRSGS